MSCPGLDPDPAAALQVLKHGLGPLQVLDVRPTPPRRPACPPAPAAAGPTPVQPNLFEPTPDPAPTATATTDPRLTGLGAVAPRPALSPTSTQPGGTADELV